MNGGKSIAQLFSLDGTKVTALACLWLGEFLDPGELKWLAPQDVGIMLRTLDYLFP